MNAANPETFNRYAYVMGDPLNGNDPNGLDPPDFSTTVYVELFPFGDAPHHPQPLAPLDPSPNPDDRNFVWILQRLKLTSALRAQTATALGNLSTRCKNALSADSINLNAVESTAARTQYYNAGATEGTQLTVRNVTDAPDNETLMQALGSNIAVTLPGVFGSVANDVVIGSSFLTGTQFGSTVAASQNIVLMHEALHTGTGLNDFQLASKLGLGDFPATTDGHAAASMSISYWLEYDCPPPGN
jgi:hypothetical protein